MKKLALILAAMLVLGCACAEPTLVKSLQRVDWVDGTNLLRVEGTNGYALSDIDGNLLTEDIYGYSLYYDEGLITAGLYSGGITSNGALNIDGSVAVPCQYGDVDVLSKDWAVGIALTEATRDNFDYESWSDDSVYLIDYVDIYSLATGAKLTLPRTNYADSEAYGSTINVEDRATGKVTAYDANFNVLGELDSLYDDDFAAGMITSFYADGSYGLKNGETVILEPAYDYIYDFRDNYTEFEKEDLYGIIDTQGQVVVPAEYDDFQTSYYLSTDNSDGSGYCAGGYFCVEKGGKMGFVTAGGVTCEPKYSVDIMENNGASATFTDMEGNLNIMAGDGVITPVTGYDNVRCAYYGNGFYYTVTDADYNYGLIDWHGNVVLPCQYGSVDLSGDGRYALVEVEYGEYELYLLDGGEAAPAAAEVPAAEAVEEIAEEPAAEVSAEAPAANEFADLAKTVLESAKLVAPADGAATITLIDSAIAMLGDHPAAAVLQGAKALLTVDAAANAATVVTLIDSAIGML